jgi:prolyl-tRNA editing enzyme YbaK/EbsC (Cys-tRNA(Pro) deacylase)
MKFGKLEFAPVESLPTLVAPPTRQAVEDFHLPDVLVSEIDDALADTATFCEHYDVGLEVSANCVIVEAKRGDRVWNAACMVLATTKADVNGKVRRFLDARKISFAPMEATTALTGMQYGGITPLGLPVDWPLLVDLRVNAAEYVVIGSGLRKSKILVPGSMLATLPNATVLDIIKE